MPSGFQLKKIHMKRYCLLNPNYSTERDKWLYDDVFPVFYASGADEDRVWIRCPEYVATKMSLGKYSDGHSYVRGRTLEDAEKKLVKYGEQIKEMLLPKVKKKIIVFKINADELAIEYEVLYLVSHGAGHHYSLETADGNVRNSNYNLWSEGDVREHVGRFVEWTPEAEEWFKNASKIINEVSHEIHSMLLKPFYDDKGKITGYGYLTPDDINALIRNNTLPFMPKVKLLAGKNEEDTA